MGQKELGVVFSDGYIGRERRKSNEIWKVISARLQVNQEAKMHKEERGKGTHLWRTWYMEGDGGDKERKGR